MYRPNRIGPSQLITLESGAVAYTVLGAAAIAATLRWETTDVLAFDELRAESIVFGADISVPAGEAVAIGVKILGDQRFATGEYLLSVGGSFVGFSADDGMAARPIVGRVDENSVAAGQLAQWALVPEESSSDQRTGGAEIGALESTVNTTIVMGDFGFEAALLVNELFFGFLVMNGGAAVGAVSNALMSASIHRYLGDLAPFDPNR